MHMAFVDLQGYHSEWFKNCIILWKLLARKRFFFLPRSVPEKDVLQQNTNECTGFLPIIFF